MKRRLSAGKHRKLAAAGGGRLRWLPLASLAAYALLDFLLQYLAPSVRLQRALRIPTRALAFADVRPPHSASSRPSQHLLHSSETHRGWGCRRCWGSARGWQAGSLWCG